MHIHYNYAARDCDGPIERSRIIPAVEGESDYTLFMSELGAAINLGESTVKLDMVGEDMHYVATVSGPTDEGYYSVELRLCKDDCDESEKYYRDVYAEMMGY